MTLCFIRPLSLEFGWSNMAKPRAMLHAVQINSSEETSFPIHTLHVLARALSIPKTKTAFLLLRVQIRLTHFCHLTYKCSPNGACTHGIAGKGTRRRAARGHRTWHLEGAAVLD